MEPRITIIIPTHRRVDAVARCVESLARQTAPAEQFEVLVVDDGSPEADHARLEALVGERFAALPITLWRQEPSGPARARNEAVRRARAPLVLLLNDDVTLAPDHVAAHLAAHAEAPDERDVFRGVTAWSDEMPDTAVMRWLRANTFRYDHVQSHPVENHFAHFHTCDLSLKRSLLKAFPFDEGFRMACHEDTELALRLLKAGRLRLHLLPEAQSWHHHLYTFGSLRRWARMRGRTTALLLRRHPELEWRLRGGYLRLASMGRRRLRVLGAAARGRGQILLTELTDLITLRQINRHLPRPQSGDGGPYPEVLLRALPPETADSPE